MGTSLCKQLEPNHVSVSSMQFRICVLSSLFQYTLPFKNLNNSKKKKSNHKDWDHLSQVSKSISIWKIRISLKYPTRKCDTTSALWNYVFIQSLVTCHCTQPYKIYNFHYILALSYINVGHSSKFHHLWNRRAFCLRWSSWTFELFCLLISILV